MIERFWRQIPTLAIPNRTRLRVQGVVNEGTLSYLRSGECAQISAQTRSGMPKVSARPGVTRELLGRASLRREVAGETQRERSAPHNQVRLRAS
jgi:hypothetical protein